MSKGLNNLKSHFKFNKQERSGIFFLLFLIIILQFGYILYLKLHHGPVGKAITVDEKTQDQIEELKALVSRNDSLKTYPFNPNYISDYKGYALGMSVDEINRLHAFRARDKFVNSASEFQSVTQVSDSLLEKISKNFKFPRWANRDSPMPEPDSLGPDMAPFTTTVERSKADLNSASAADLMAVPGIGETLSARIIKFRDRLGGFLVGEQIYDVYGLEAEVAERTLQRFEVQNMPQVNRINLNSASVSELVKLVYIRYAVAQAIVAYREKNGSFASFDELKDIENFPSDKIDRIKLYLTL